MSYLVARRLAVVGWLLLGATGCSIRAESHDLVRYDAARDELHLTRLFLQISGDEPRDREYILRLYRERQHLIPEPPFPFGRLSLFETQAMYRLDGERSLDVPLTKVGDRTPPVRAAFDLNQVQIQPGEFFLDSEENLCVTHSAVFPGPVLDALVAAQSQNLRKMLQEGLEAETQRREEGYPERSWDALRTKLLTWLENPNGGQEDGNPIESPLALLDEASLINLEKACVENMLVIRRDKLTLTVDLPLSPRDQKEILATVAALREALDKSQEMNFSPPDRKFRQILKVFVGQTLRSSPTVLTVSFNAESLYREVAATRSVREAQAAVAPADPGLVIARKATVATARAWDIEVGKPTRLDDLLDTYDRRQLRPVTLEKSVPAVEHLFP